MKKSIRSVLFVFVVLTVLVSGCAPASTPVPPTNTPVPTNTSVSTDTPVPTLTPLLLAKIEGRIYFNSKFLSASVHPCQVTEFSPDTPVVAADIDWSGLTSEGWSRADGFRWQGDVHALGFTCTLDPNLKFELGTLITAGDEKPFVILDVPTGKFAIVVILTESMGDAPQLFYGENSVPLVFDLTSEHSIDIGLLTINGE
jgi:hypothetical protein